MSKSKSYKVGISQSAARVAAKYAACGVLWIWLSDLTLLWLGYSDDHAFIAAAIKGTTFVAFTAGLLFWLVQREVASVRRSDILLRAVIEGTTDAVFLKDVNGCYLLVNDAAARFVGKSVQEVLGRNDTELFDNPADAERVMSRDQAIMATGSAITLDDTITSAGVSRTYQTTSAPYRDETGKVAGLIGISRDISERKQIDLALQESEARFRELADAIPQIVWTAGPDGGLTHLNARAISYSGFELDRLLGWQWGNVIHPDDTSVAVGMWTAIVKSGNPHDLEFRIRRVDGTYRWHVCRQVPKRSADGAISGWYGTCTDIDDQKLVEARLREQSMLVREAADLAKVAGWGFDPATMHADWTPEVARIYGVDLASPPSVSEAIHMFSPEQRPALEVALSAAIQEGTPYDLELELNAADGQKKWVRTICRPIMEQGRVIRVRGSLQDITERKCLQEQFFQAQKMEAVGRLAGGVAHDFNNILTVINASCELLLMSDLPVGDPRREPVTLILDAGQRAARLTQQLLALSRRGIVEPKVIDLNELISGSAQLLQRLIGEDILLAVVTAPIPIRVRADRSQLEQVIMNLAVNARDAMPTGGRLTIETSIITSPNGEPSRFAGLSITDTGYGMTNEVKGKAFEPFFTTKEVGKGSGLGLAVVHGVVAQCGGQIEIETSVGVGTTFRILLPLVDVEPDAVPPSVTVASTSRGTETILLVEDEEAVRRVVCDSLQLQGYTVLQANGGAEAVHLAKTHPGTIDLLLSDVVMSDMGGRQVIEVVRRFRSGLRVLFMSGYTDDAILLHGVVEATDAFIQKPFTPLELAKKVREVIDAPLN